MLKIRTLRFINAVAYIMLYVHINMVIPSQMQVLHKGVCYSYHLDVGRHPASERHSYMDGAYNPASRSISIPCYILHAPIQSLISL
jgi:hypothetical protein